MPASGSPLYPQTPQILGCLSSTPPSPPAAASPREGGSAPARAGAAEGGFGVPAVLESAGPGQVKEKIKSFLFFFLRQEAPSLDRSKDAKTAPEAEGG